MRFTNIAPRLRVVARKNRNDVGDVFFSRIAPMQCQTKFRKTPQFTGGIRKSEIGFRNAIALKIAFFGTYSVYPDPGSNSAGSRNTISRTSAFQNPILERADGDFCTVLDSYFKNYITNLSSA